MTTESAWAGNHRTPEAAMRATERSVRRWWRQFGYRADVEAIGAERREYRDGVRGWIVRYSYRLPPRGAR